MLLSHDRCFLFSPRLISDTRHSVTPYIVLFRRSDVLFVQDFVCRFRSIQGDPGSFRRIQGDSGISGEFSPAARRICYNACRSARNCGQQSILNGLYTPDDKITVTRLKGDGISWRISRYCWWMIMQSFGTTYGTPRRFRMAFA